MVEGKSRECELVRWRRIKWLAWVRRFVLQLLRWLRMKSMYVCCATAFYEDYLSCQTFCLIRICYTACRIFLIYVLRDSAGSLLLWRFQPCQLARIKREQFHTCCEL